MPDFSKRAQKRFTAHLRPDEEFVVAGVVQPKGSVSRGLNERGRLGSAMADAVAAKLDDSDAGLLADRVPRRNGYLVVTTSRVAWLRQGRWGWPTRDLDAEFTAAELSDVDERPGQGVGNTDLTLRFTDGSTTQLLAHASQDPVRLLAGNEPPT
ncbi:MAG: hypothetical protein AAGA99_07790 [Actinomycetota bacterium]